MARRHRYQRIVFIEPKSTHIHVYSAVHIPRIGSILLSTLLKEKGYDVTVIIEDMLRKGVGDDKVWDQIRQADMLCVSSITSTVQRCYNYCDRARKAGIPVVLGGTHVTYFPDEAIQHADYVVRGECDESFPLFMDTLEGGGDFTKVPGLSWHEGGTVHHNPEPKLPTSAVLEANPFPDYNLLWETNLKGGVASFAVARGCPFDCSFCSVTKFNGAAVRTVSAERTLDMIEEHWKRYKPHYIFFAEDIFNQMKTRAKDILRGLIKRDIRPRIGFGAQMRHEVVKDPEFLELMRDAKFDRAMVGFESINQASLDLCGKREYVEQIRHAIHEFHKYKVKVHGMFVGGFDTDTPQTFHDTLDFVRKHDLDSFQLMLLTPLPGTRDWNHEGFADGSRPMLTHDWSKFDGHHAIQVPKQMTPYEANTLALSTMKKFYNVPGAFKRLFRGDWIEFLMRIEGNSLLKRWWRSPENVEYLNMLKQQLQPTPTVSPVVELKRRVIIAHTAASIAFKDRLDKFFGELGIRVEHSKEGLGELLEQGQLKVADVRKRVVEFFGDSKLFNRDHADLVVIPSDRGNAVSIDAVEIDKDAPPMVWLNINERASVLAQQCVNIAMRFTGDVLEAAEAFRRSMVQLTPVPVPVTTK